MNRSTRFTWADALLLACAFIAAYGPSWNDPKFVAVMCVFVPALLVVGLVAAVRALLRVL